MPKTKQAKIRKRNQQLAKTKLGNGNYPDNYYEQYFRITKCGCKLANDKADLHELLCPECLGKQPVKLDRN